jgi:hypothetical protein
MNISSNQPTSAKSSSTGGGLFRMDDGKNYFGVFVLVTSLFLLWGFCNGMIDILNKHFQDSLHINKEQSGLVQSANYLAYFLMAIPAGLIARKFGYKGGIIVGLSLIAAGAFWFIPAVNIWPILGVPARPVRHRGGHDVFGNHRQSLRHRARCAGTRRDAHQHRADHQRRRLDSRPDCRRLFLVRRRQGCQVVGGSGDGQYQRRPCHAVSGHRDFCPLLLVIFAVSKVPDLHAKHESQKSAGQKNKLKPSSGQLAGIAVTLALVCGLLYFFIAPVLGLIWALIQLPEALFARSNMDCSWQRM